MFAEISRNNGKISKKMKSRNVEHICLLIFLKLTRFCESQNVFKINFDPRFL